MPRPPLDLTLYLVTDRRLCAAAGVVATAAAAVAAGVTVVQLRDHGAGDPEFVALGRELVAALAGTGVPLIVDDRVHLVEAIGAAGAHVGQGDLPADEARRVVGPDRLLGLSVQTPGQVATARTLGDAVDYLGVGPVWAQTTKADAAAPIGPAGLAAVTRLSRWPCVAIGGVTATGAADVRRAGAAGMAVVSAVCGRPDVPAAVADLLRAWRAAV